MMIMYFYNASQAKLEQLSTPNNNIISVFLQPVKPRWPCICICMYTGAVPANQPISDGEATDRCKSLRRKMADCPSK